MSGQRPSRIQEKAVSCSPSRDLLLNLAAYIHTYKLNYEMHNLFFSLSQHGFIQSALWWPPRNFL